MRPKFILITSGSDKATAQPYYLNIGGGNIALIQDNSAVEGKCHVHFTGERQYSIPVDGTAAELVTAVTDACDDDAGALVDQLAGIQEAIENLLPRLSAIDKSMETAVQIWKALGYQAAGAVESGTPT